MNLEKQIHAADDAFGEVIARAFPEVTTGDFPPDATLAWHEAIEKAIKCWLYYNFPFEPGLRFTLARDVDRFPDFVAKAGLTGTITLNNDNDIWAKMDQHIAGCEHWDNTIHWESRMEFIDDIDLVGRA